MSFKVGDKVIVKHKERFTKPSKIIRILEGNNNKLYILEGIKSINNVPFAFKKHQLITEEIWNSPLFQALKEEE